MSRKTFKEYDAEATIANGLIDHCVFKELRVRYFLSAAGKIKKNTRLIFATFTVRLPALFTTVRYNGNRTYSQRIVHKGTVEELGKISRATRRVFPTAETWLLCSMKVLLRGLNDSVKREANGK